MNNTNYQRLTKEQLAARVVGDIFDGAVVKDALNNSFPGVLRLGYFSDGANLS